MDVVQSCQQVVDEARRMIGSVRPLERSRRTPCSGWDVNALVYHMIGTCASFTSWLQEAASGNSTNPPEPDFDLARAYVQVTDLMMREWRAPDALDRILKTSLGEAPGAVAIWIVMADQMVHTWDLAKALGRPYSMPEEIASALLPRLQQFIAPTMRGPGKGFGLEVECPADAPIEDRLVAFLGRQP